MRKANRHMKDAADAADATFTETQKANILALRPYFEIVSADLQKVKTHIPPEYFAMRFIVDIKNIGETQATGLKLEITSMHGIASQKARLNPFMGLIGLEEKIWNFRMGLLHGSNLNTNPPQQELLSRGESVAFPTEVTFKVEDPIESESAFTYGAEDILGISHIEARFDGTIEFDDLKPNDRRICEFSIFLFRETNDDGVLVQARPDCRITSDRYRSERKGK